MHKGVFHNLHNKLLFVRCGLSTFSKKNLLFVKWLDLGKKNTSIAKCFPKIIIIIKDLEARE